MPDGTASRRSRFSLDPSSIFLMLALPFGIAFAVLLPPGAAPDELPHLGRVWLISGGTLGVPGRATAPAFIPQSLVRLDDRVSGARDLSPAEWRSWFSWRLEPGEQVRLAKGGWYSPLAYLPQIPGAWVGRWLEVSPAALVLLARLGGLLVWIGLVWVAIRACPVAPLAFALAALMPTSLAIAASVSADTMTNASVFLVVSLWARAACQRGRMSKRDIAGFLGACLLLSGSKQAYLPLCLLACAIPVERFATRGGHLALAGAATAVTLLPAVAWWAVVTSAEAVHPTLDADPAAQLSHVVSAPLAFAVVLFDSARIFGLAWFQTLVGVFGSLAVSLPVSAAGVYAIATLAAAVGDAHGTGTLSGTARIWLVAIATCCVGAVFGLAYMGWNPVGADLIQGVQGRYFVPIIPLLICALPRVRGLASASIMAVPVAAVCIAWSVALVVDHYFAF